ncbi:TRAP transporter substrate-binding protein DctP [Amphritea sp. 1_MG-2023]|uniref:TRAP transporter substrate-binding protein DctP n=1 Tax=Amphritea sp. 1_MG-2023 TaxID=3062670 RepID=UPI0026E14C03|nr:TRAP transporter substrate-binding protein DctP [Amphritea sp. 1_MG-2023]MDO6561992.1 TRAP transporter substrate-binding protein DctP [Amphritea sp. 1_MG-2023]
MLTSLSKKLVLAASLSLATLGVAEAATLKLSHVRPQGTAIDKDATQFAEAVNAATDGKLKVKLYPANALGDYTVVQERVGLGAVDMAVQPIASSVDKRFQIVSLPYMAQDWADAQKKFGPGSVMRNTVSDLYQQQGIKVLGAWPVYFGGVALNQDVEGAADSGVSKAAKVRVPPIKVFQLLADSLGYIASPLPFSEAFTAVQTGVVDGVIGSGAEGYYASFRDVTKYYVPINTHFEVWYLLINEERFNDLKADQRQAVAQAALEFENRRWETAEKDQAANEQRLVDAGATIVEVTPEQLAATAAKIKQNVWPEIVNDIGKEWADEILKAALSE